MPRRSRRKSHSGIYHAMVRGIDRQLIFRDPADFLKYLRVLEECKRVSGFEVYAYCIMPNHVHLLIREGSEDLGKAFQRIGSRYAYWFNKKYERCGHLFQDRFKSEPVDDNRYLLTLLRYIHRNPVAAGICRDVADYSWSSYWEFLGKKALVDPDYPLKLFSDSKKVARSAFIEHVNRGEDPMQPVSIEPYMRHKAQAAFSLSSEISNRIDENERALRLLAAQGIEDRNRYIRKLKSEGVPMHHIAKHLKVSIWTVRNA